jgi:hypothetical protein
MDAFGVPVCVACRSTGNALPVTEGAHSALAAPIDGQGLHGPFVPTDPGAIDAAMSGCNTSLSRECHAVSAGYQHVESCFQSHLM